MNTTRRSWVLLLVPALALAAVIAKPNSTPAKDGVSTTANLPDGAIITEPPLLPAMAHPMAPAMAPMQMTGGYVTGTQVPDSVAQRLILLNIGIANPSPSQDDLNAQQALVGAIGLSTADAQVLINAANQFAVNHQNWKTQFNQQTTSGLVAPDDATMTSTVLAQRNVYVTSAMNNIANNMTADGYNMFSQFIQSEKVNMQTTEAF